MVHGTVRSLLRLLEALTVLLLIATALTAWRLSRGPVDLDFLTPYIVEGLGVKGGAFHVEIDHTVLTWAGWQRALDLRAVGVRAVSTEKGVIAAVPEVSLSLSGRALLKGLVAPRSVEIFRPRVRLFRSGDGRLHWGLGDNAGEGSNPVIAQLYRELLEAPDSGSSAGHLSRVELHAAELTIDDEALGVTWRSPEADLLFTRDQGGISADLHLLVDVGGELTSVDGNGRYSQLQGAVDLLLTVRDLRPDVFARLSPDLAPLAALDLPLSGVVELRVDVESGIEKARFDITGGAGLLRLPAPVALDYPVASLELRGSLADQARRVTVEALRVDLGGPVLTADAVVDVNGADLAMRGAATMTDVHFDTLAAYWPAELGKNARSWVTQNLSDGIAREARVAVAAHRGVDGKMVIEKLDGSLYGDGVTVDYLSPMPKVSKATASATFDAKSFRIAVGGGEVYGLKVTGGDILLGALDTNDEFAEIRLNVEGPLADALTLIDQKPLGYASRLGISPKQAKGQSAVELELSFPLIKTLKVDEVHVAAKAKIKDAFLPKVLMGLDLSRANLALEVDAKGMDVSGPVVLGTIPAQLNWRENFPAKAEFRSRYRIKALVEEHQRHQLHLQGPPFVAPWLIGPVRADVTATMMGAGSGRVRAAIDLTTASMEPPGFGWRKPAGEQGSAEVDIRIDKEKVAAVPQFSVRSGDLTVDGAVDFDSAGEARRVAFSRLRYGRTDASGDLVLRKDQGMAISLRGASFDAQPLLSGKAEPGAPRKKGRDDLPPMTIAAKLGRLWLGEKSGFDDVDAELSRDDKLWRTARLDAGLVSGQRVAMTMAPQGHGRGFAVSSPDAGGVFKALDIFDNLIGGVLDVKGTVEDTAGGDVYHGRAEVKDYQVVKAPVLARVLTVAALAGIVDLLRGEGINFSTLDAPFTLRDGVLELGDTTAYGTALGITAKGRFDLDADRVAVDGTIVPMYALNSIVGNIPLIGQVLTGDKGSGVFAATYSVKGPTADPDVSVNPLAALAPGFLRKFFNLFSEPSAPAGQDKP